MNAEDVSKALAARFLEEGGYESLGTPLSDERAPAFAAHSSDFLDNYFAEDGFAGLAVQSVGYTKGASNEEVVIYVTKGSQKALKSLPKNVEGCPVSARVMGRLKAGPGPSRSIAPVGNFYERKGRIACGSSCAPSGERYAGTLGAFLADGNRIIALSNNHIFSACNHTPIGMPILAPAAMDARPNRRAPTEIGVFDRMIELRSGSPGLVDPMLIDAALALVNHDDLITSWQGDATGFDTPRSVTPPRSGMRVKKIGRTTGQTEGIVEAYIPTLWSLPYKSTRFTAEVWFQDAWTIKSIDDDPFSLPGDSGSLVVTEDGASAIGLIFAGNSGGGYSIMCDLTLILRSFGNLRLLSDYGI